MQSGPDAGQNNVTELRKCINTICELEISQHTVGVTFLSVCGDHFLFPAADVGLTFLGKTGLIISVDSARVVCFRSS